MTITVHGAAYSTCTQRVLTTLEELGVEYKLETVELKTGGHKSPEYLKLQVWKIPKFAHSRTRWSSVSVTRSVESFMGLSV